MHWPKLGLAGKRPAGLWIGDSSWSQDPRSLFQLLDADARNLLDYLRIVLFYGHFQFLQSHHMFHHVL